jgi:hypothetical protein
MMSGNKLKTNIWAKCVEKFVHLGILITWDNNCSSEINGSLEMAASLLK